MRSISGSFNLRDRSGNVLEATWRSEDDPAAGPRGRRIEVDVPGARLATFLRSSPTARLRAVSDGSRYPTIRDAVESVARANGLALMRLQAIRGWGPVTQFEFRPAITVVLSDGSSVVTDFVVWDGARHHPCDFHGDPTSRRAIKRFVDLELYHRV